MKTRSVVLGDIADTCLGKMLDQRKNKGDYQPYLANVNVRWGSFDLDNLPQMRFLKSEEERYGLQYGDILICEGGEPGRCAIWKDQIPGMKFQKALHRVRVHEVDVDFRWLFYRFLYARYRGEFDQYFSGTTTIKHMPGEKLVKIRIDLPEKYYQSKIADILSSYDDLIENNRKQIKLLEEAAQRLYKEWFVDLRFPGYEETPIVDGVPAGWERTSLEDIIEFNPKVILNKERIKQCVPMSALSTSSMVINSQEFTNTISNAGSKFQNGDTLLARITPCLENGKTGFVGNIKSPEGAVGSTEFIVMRSRKLCPYMVYLLSRTDDFRKTAINSMTGSDGRQRAQVDKIKSYVFVCPPQNVIESFEVFVAPFFKAISIYNKQCIELSEARDRLLPKLMSGEIEV